MAALDDDNAKPLAKEQSGVSLSDYQNELTRERRSRTLTLRRPQHPTISQIMKASKAKLTATDPTLLEHLTASYFTSVFQSTDPAPILDLLKSTLDVYQESPKIVSGLIQSPSISEMLTNFLSSTDSEPLILAVLQFIATTFPLCDKNQVKLVDDGLCMTVLTLLGSDSLTLVNAAISVISIISDCSSYARDSVLCLGLHSELINLAKKEADPSITEASCSALMHVFNNPEDIDSNALSNCVEAVASLLSIKSMPALRSVIMSLLAITNKKPSLVFTLADLGYYPTIVKFLKVPELTDATLPLIGNMSFGHTPSVQILLDAQLLQILFELMDSQYTAEVFWVLSNLVESVPQLMSGVFNADFIRSTIEIAGSSSFNIKKESAFFLATLIIFSSTEEINDLIIDDVIEVLEEMLSCGNGYIIIRCIDALIRFCQIITTSSKISDAPQALQSEDLKSALEGMASHTKTVISEHADMLLHYLEGEADQIVI